jgi:hypothetical protein
MVTGCTITPLFDALGFHRDHPASRSKVAGGCSGVLVDLVRSGRSISPSSGRDRPPGARVAAIAPPRRGRADGSVGRSPRSLSDLCTFRSCAGGTGVRAGSTRSARRPTPPARDRAASQRRRRPGRQPSRQLLRRRRPHLRGVGQRPCRPASARSGLRSRRPSPARPQCGGPLLPRRLPRSRLIPADVAHARDRSGGLGADGTTPQVWAGEPITVALVVSTLERAGCLDSTDPRGRRRRQDRRSPLS